MLTLLISNSGRLLLGFGAVPIRRQQRVLIGDGVVELLPRELVVLRSTLARSCQPIWRW
jgi:hypothetical protein